jgi:hypothetical protein
MLSESIKKRRMWKKKKRDIRRDWKKKTIVKIKQGMNYNKVFALIDNIKDKLQEIEDMQAWKLISFEKVTNPVEGLKTQTWFEKIKLMLSIMVKLHSLIFNNDGIQTTSILLRQDIVKRKKRWKNDDNWYWEGVLKFNIN